MVLRCAILLAWVGCAESSSYELYEGQAEHMGRVSVYLEPNETIAPDVALHGCNLWRPEGADCVLVPNPGESRVDIWVDIRTDCKRDGNNHIAHATLGTVVVYPECLHHVYGRRVLPEEMALIIGHEFGHLFGIGHIPWDCDDPVGSLHPEDPLPIDGEGRLICGNAVMNTLPFTAFDGPIGITTTDHRGFLARDRTNALF